MVEMVYPHCLPPLRREEYWSSRHPPRSPEPIPEISLHGPETYGFAGREIGTFPVPHEYAREVLFACTTLEVDTVLQAIAIAALHGPFWPCI